MKIYEFLKDIRIQTFAQVPEEYRYLFEKLQGNDGFWPGDVLDMLVSRDFAQWRREELLTLPGIVPWAPGTTVAEESGVYIEAWPFKVTTYFETFPRIVLTALQEYVDQTSAQDLLANMLDGELRRSATGGVWFGKNVVVELMARRDAANPTKLIITYTDGLEANA